MCRRGIQASWPQIDEIRDLTYVRSGPASRKLGGWRGIILVRWLTGGRVALGIWGGRRVTRVTRVTRFRRGVGGVTLLRPLLYKNRNREKGGRRGDWAVVAGVIRDDGYFGCGGGCVTRHCYPSGRHFCPFSSVSVHFCPFLSILVHGLSISHHVLDEGGRGKSRFFRGYWGELGRRGDERRGDEDAEGRGREEVSTKGDQGQHGRQGEAGKVSAFVRFCTIFGKVGNLRPEC